MINGRRWVWMACLAFAACVCVEPSSVSTSCTVNEDCPAPQRCCAGTCAARCTNDAGSLVDAGAVDDAGLDVDAGADFDAGAEPDGGQTDAGSTDAGFSDAGSTADAGARDAGLRDDDNDGWPRTTDCNDNNPAINPGVTERCDDGVDNNCDGDPDCVDPECAGQACVDRLSCTSGPGVCRVGVCVEPTRCAPLTGQVCLQVCADELASACVARPVPLPATCDDNDTCTTGDSCADGGCFGTPMMCPDTGESCRPSLCFNGMGCLTKLLDAGSACDDDGQPCTADLCDSTGICQHTLTRRMPCPGGACSSTGACVPNGFAFPPSNIDEATLLFSSQQPPANCQTTFSTSGSLLTVVSSTCMAVNSIWLSYPRDQLDGGSVMVLPVIGPWTLPSTSSVRFIGTRPVVIMVRGNAFIDGTLSVEAQATTSGAGADGCTAGFGEAGATGQFNPTGGGGSGFGSPGGYGSLNGNARSDGGSTEGNAALVPLRGGCRGGVAGPNNSRTPGGGGGGAIQLSVSGTLSITGRILASGGGGRRGPGVTSAATGGGSGGGLLLEANAFSIAPTAIIAANGGAGGQGSTSSDPGDDGADGQPTTMPALGGAAVASCGDYGGNGAAASTAAQGGKEATPSICNFALRSGGGGGGGVGRIRFNSVGACTVPSGAIVSPAPSTSCR